MSECLHLLLCVHLLTSRCSPSLSPSLARSAFFPPSTPSPVAPADLLKRKTELKAKLAQCGDQNVNSLNTARRPPEPDLGGGGGQCELGADGVLDCRPGDSAGSPPPSSCALCGQLIQDRFIMKLDRRCFHERCLTCSCCALPLDAICYQRDAKLYCRRDYLR